MNFHILNLIWITLHIKVNKSNHLVLNSGFDYSLNFNLNRLKFIDHNVFNY